MNCNDVRDHWSLYHDSEGDPDLHWQVSEHLAGCSACADWFSKQSRLEVLLQDKFADAATDEAMWDRALTSAGVVQPAQVASRPRWFMLSTLAACAAAMLIAVGVWQILRPADADMPATELSALTADLHDRLASGVTAVAFESGSDLAVEEFLRTKVSFPVRCPPRKGSGFLVRGARTCKLGSEPVAIVAGFVGGEPVSIFIFSEESLAAFPAQREALEAQAVVCCREGEFEMAFSVVDRNVVVVVGRVASASLRRVLAAYGTYPEPHG